jgi:hypothetical protein
MVKLGKLGVACALCLTMSLSLFTSGVFAQSANPSTASNSAQIVTAHMPQRANSALQNNQSLRSEGASGEWNNSCGDGCDDGCFSACGIDDGFDGATRITRVVHIVRITKFFRYEHFHHHIWDGGCGSCGGDGWVGGGGW